MTKGEQARLMAWRSRVPQLRVTGIELLPVRATSRTVWLIVQLRTDGGLDGLGEASDALGFANTMAEDTARMRAQLAAFFNLARNRFSCVRSRAWVPL